MHYTSACTLGNSHILALLHHLLTEPCCLLNKDVIYVTKMCTHLFSDVYIGTASMQCVTACMTAWPVHVHYRLYMIACCVHVSE